MNKVNFYTLVLLSFLALSERARSSDGLYMVVTPGSADGFTCQISPENDPPQIRNELVRYRVHVQGGKAPYKWRLPLYTKDSDINSLAVARIGHAKLEADRSFYIDLATIDLAQLQSEHLTLQLESHDGLAADCTTPSKKVRQLAFDRPAANLGVVQGSAVR